jgi:hypothetical protein
MSLTRINVANVDIDPVPPTAPSVIAVSDKCPSLSWMHVMFAGVNSPGIIPRNGLTGFKRKFTFDQPQGKGVQGAKLVITKVPPIEGQVTLQLLTKQDFADWDQFAALLCNPLDQNGNAIGRSVFHPSFQSIGLVAAVCTTYEGPLDMGRGIYLCKFNLLEYAPVPAASIVSVAASVAPDVPPATNAPPPVDPRIAARQAEIAGLAAASANVLGPAVGSGGG